MDDLFDPASSIGRPALFSSHAMPHRGRSILSDLGFRISDFRPADPGLFP